MSFPKCAKNLVCGSEIRVVFATFDVIYLSMKKILFTLFTAALFAGYGQSNYVMDFNGSANTNMGNSAGNGVRSIEFWFKPSVTMDPNTTATGWTFISRDDNSQFAEYGVYIRGTDWNGWGNIGNLCFWVRYSGVLHEVKSNQNTWTAGTWYHIAGVLDPSTGMKLYVNGILQTDMDASGTSAVMTDTGTPTFVGSWGSSIRFFQGRMDEMRLWNRAISQSEILAKMCQSLVPSNETGFQAYWKFNEGSGTQVNDMTANAYNGTVNNGTWVLDDPCFTPLNYAIAEGHVYDDLNSDCLQQAGDLPLSNWLIKADPGPYYASVDANGYYSMPLSPGTYTLTHLVNSSTHLWDTVCPAPAYTHTTNLNAGDTASNLDFALHASMYCAILNVDVAGVAVRRCMHNSYYVQYSNTGNDTANNVIINLTLDSLLSISSSSVPWDTLLGNTYTFNIGTLVPYQSGMFTFTAYLDCGATMGSTRCVKAEIGPLTACTYPVDSTWDHSSVKVEGSCSDTLACFVIENTGSAGSGDMQGPSNYRIYENGVLVFSGTFQLTGGTNTTICWPANGNTIQLQADQRPGHPGHSHPNAYVEDCGTPVGMQPIFGIANTMPPDDDNYEVEIECLQVTGSFDPNDKAVIPAGVGVNHNIKEEDELEYKIRFQNTGTDTAFTVVIRDTLSTFLDPATVISGVSSHNYTFKVFGNGILEWTFGSILLPDSNVNEPASHGFVKFRVKQMPGNPVGTLIENRVGIIFDFNDPVMTNTTFNTVWQEQGLTIAQGQALGTTKVYPNPSDGLLFFEVDTSINTWNLSIMDAVGRVIKVKDIINSNKTSADISGLAKGVYFFRVVAANGFVSTGKIIKH